VDLTTISQRLGHAHLNTINRYATIDLEMKRKAIERVRPLENKGDLAPHTNRWVNNCLKTLLSPVPLFCILSPGR
jgi:hypothetical protein